MAALMTDRLEREIEEILDKIEKFPSPESRRARARKQAIRRFGGAIAAQQRAFASQLGRISMSQVMLVSFLLILGYFFFGRYNPLMMRWVLYAGIILFVTSFTILMFTRRSSLSGASSQERWRGRPVRSAQQGATLAERVRMWWRQRTSRR
jgi:hypothetical protein